MDMETRGDRLRELNLLIVDDNPGDRVLYRELLQEADPGTAYRFTEADCAAAAMERLREQEFDCILLDYLLPDRLGLELLQTLRQEEACTAPVVMLTGFGDESTAVSAIKGGAQGYVPKRELTGKSLLTALDQARRSQRQARESERRRQEMDERNRDLEGRVKQAQSLYRDVLARLGKPVRSIRDRVNALAVACDGVPGLEVESSLLELQAETERLLRTLGNLADNPRVSLGQLLVSTQPQSLTELVFDAVNAFRSVAEAAGVRVTVRMQPGLPDVAIDRYRIEQVLINLLDNAIRFTPPAGKVNLLVEEAPDLPRRVCVTVRDSGCGIPLERQRTLFDRPADGPADPGASGLGLGLPICREIIQSHDGTIHVDSTPGQGTSVTFSLPLAKNELPAARVWEQATGRGPRSEWRMTA